MQEKMYEFVPLVVDFETVKERPNVPFRGQIAPVCQVLRAYLARAGTLTNCCVSVMKAVRWPP